MILRTDVHVCLVYEVVVSNLTPALDPNFRPKEIIFVYAPDQQSLVHDLEEILRPIGILVSHWLIEEAREIESLRERLLELLVEREGQSIALNASGGTRPMGLAAYEIFHELNKPIFYVRPDTDEVVWIHQRHLPSFNLADRIKLPAFLQAHGAKLLTQRDSEITQALRHLTEELVTHIDKLTRPLATVNWLAQKAEQNLTSPPLTENQRHWPELIALIKRFEQEKLLTYDQTCLHFTDESCRFFVNGGWLEEHIFGLVFGLRAEIREIQDVGRSIEIVRDSTGHRVKNELDVAFLHNNHLYLIECKTKSFETDEDGGTQALYKLETLTHLLGGQAMLVSYHPLSSWDKQRAQDLHIEMCTAQQLGRFKEILKQWITAPKKRLRKEVPYIPKESSQSKWVEIE